MKKKVLSIVTILLLFIVIILVRDDNSTTKVVGYNGNNLRISIDGNVSSTLPTNGTYYLVSYDCKDDSTKITWDKETYELDVTNGTKKGRVSCYLNFKSKPLLSEMEPGSYVAYVGDSSNGCDDTNEVNGYTACSGKNANYVSDTDMGYCSDSDYKFITNGWRIGYIEKGSAYLVSAGAPECMCTDSTGVVSNSSCSNSLSSSNLYMHFDNADEVALKYCNQSYARDGVCDDTTSRSMDANDFFRITGSTLSYSSCYNKMSNVGCGYTNELIDNGGYYWFTTAYKSTDFYTFAWTPPKRDVYVYSSSFLSGVRPVLSLDSTVYVTGGSGTYGEPYQIANNYFVINSGDYELNSGTDDLSNIPMTLNAANVSKMCISVNTSVCTNYIDYSSNYSLDLSNIEGGTSIVYVYFKDYDGNIVSSMNKSIVLAVAYTITINSVTGGSVSVSESTVYSGDTVTFTVTPTTPTTSTHYGYNGSTISYTENGITKTMNLAGNVKTFTMPASDVVITPSFVTYAITFREFQYYLNYTLWETNNVWTIVRYYYSYDPVNNQTTVTFGGINSRVWGERRTTSGATIYITVTANDSGNAATATTSWSKYLSSRGYGVTDALATSPATVIVKHSDTAGAKSITISSSTNMTFRYNNSDGSWDGSGSDSVTTGTYAG